MSWRSACVGCSRRRRNSRWPATYISPQGPTRLDKIENLRAGIQAGSLG